MLNCNAFAVCRTAVAAGAVTFLAVCLAFVSPARADYVLGGGDVLLLSVFGSPELTRKITVTADGQVSIPLLGEVKAGGESLSQLRQKIEQALIQNNVIRGPSVALEVVEYRPFYIGGYVSRPGAYSYRPAITVRNAVVMAGGYGLTRTLGSQQIDVPNVTANFKSLWHLLIEQDARVQSLRAELNGLSHIDLKEQTNTPVDPTFISEIASLESSHLKMRLKTLEEEQESLRRSIKLSAEEKAELEKQLVQEKEGLQFQGSQLEKTENLHERGLGTRTNVAQQQQVVTQIKSRIFEVSASIARAARDRSELLRQLDKVREERRLLALRELQTAMVERERTRSELEAVGERLLQAGALISLSESLHTVDPRVRIHRKKDGKRLIIEGGLDDFVEPDDVIDVIIKPTFTKFPWRLKEMSGKNEIEPKPATRAAANENKQKVAVPPSQ